VKLFAFWLGLIGSTTGAVFGAIDLDLLGGLVGAGVGGFVGTLVGQGLDLLIGPFLGYPEDRTFGKWVFRLVGLVLLIVVGHELFWAANLVSLAATHNVGARLCHHVRQTDTLATMQDTVGKKRWQVALFTARPLLWGEPDDILKNNRGTLDLIDDVVAGRIPQASTVPLRTRANALMQRCDGLVDRFLPRTWLLRYLPRELLIPKE